MTLADQFNAWADQLVDLSGRNDLISFRQTRTSTLALSAEAADFLLTGEWCPVRQLVNLGEKSSKDQLRKLIATSEENSDQLGIQTLRFVSGFAEWNTDKISNPRAPFQLIEVQVRGGGTNLERCEFRLDREAASINPVLIQYFRSFAGLQLSDEATETMQSTSCLSGDNSQCRPGPESATGTVAVTVNKIQQYYDMIRCNAVQYSGQWNVISTINRSGY